MDTGEFFCASPETNTFSFPVGSIIYRTMTNAIVEINLIDEFLLNDGPKQDCLVHICEYLSGNDLVNLSDSNLYTELFIEFLNDRVNFAKKTFDFTNIEDKEKVFQNFGQNMQRLQVNN